MNTHGCLGSKPLYHKGNGVEHKGGYLVEDLHQLLQLHHRGEDYQKKYEALVAKHHALCAAEAASRRALLYLSGKEACKIKHILSVTGLPRDFCFVDNIPTGD